jgi:hypothetical protein
VVALLLGAMLGAMLGACTTAPLTRRIVLLAPFEGVHRAIGYQALYAARLALGPYARTVELLPLDDGGSPMRAAERAAAAARDPQVAAALVLGPGAHDAAFQQAWGDVPVVVVGGWADECAHPSVRLLTSPALAAIPRDASLEHAAARPDPVVGRDLLALPEFARLRAAEDRPIDGVTVWSVGRLPDAAYTRMYTESDRFAPPPALPAPLVTDAAAWVTGTVAQQGARAAVLSALTGAAYSGQWHTWTMGACTADMAVFRYRYQGGALQPDPTPGTVP